VPARSALLVIDIQRAAFDGVRCPPMDAPDALLASAHTLIAAARDGGHPIVYIQHAEGAGAPFEEGTEHFQLHPSFAPGRGDVRITKHKSSSFDDTPLDAELKSRSIGTLVVCGLQSEHCVSNTTHSALQLGYAVHVARDGHGTWPDGGRSAAEIRNDVNTKLAAAGASVTGTDELARNLRSDPTAMPDDTARNELAPTGTLRPAMNLSNALFTGKDAATGELKGVSVDVWRELGSRLGVPVEFILFDTPGDVADAVDSGRWDVAILAIEPARAQTIAFSPPITAIEATYAVHDDSPLQSVADVDAAGIRIVAPNKAGYELFLTRTLQHATLIRTTSFRESIDCFNERRADALSGLKPALLESLPKLRDAHLLDGRFMTVNHGLGTPRGRAAAAAYLTAFVADLNASGFVARSIARHGVQGLSPVQ
jgi:polar amino acid transport system substrate-binding protein